MNLGVEDFSSFALDLKVLFTHNVLEHDGSLVRQDNYFAGPYAPFDNDLFEQMASRSQDGIHLTFQDVMQHQRDRILNSRQCNPDHDFNDNIAMGMVRN